MMCDRKLQNYKQAKSLAYKGLTEYGLKNLTDDEVHEVIDFYVQFLGTKKNGYFEIANILLPKMQVGGDYALYKRCIRRAFIRA